MPPQHPIDEIGRREPTPSRHTRRCSALRKALHPYQSEPRLRSRRPTASRRPFVLSSTIPLLVGLAFASCVAPIAVEDRVPARGTFDEVVALVESEFYDPASLDGWRAAVVAHRRQWEGAATARDRAKVLRDLLAELGVSHTAYYSPDQPAWAELLDIFRAGPTRSIVASRFGGVVRYDTLGIVATEIGAEHFVADVFDGSPAAAAGVRAGDRILAAAELPRQVQEERDGEQPRIERLLLQGAEDEEGGRVVDVQRLRVQPEELYLSAQRASARVTERGGRRVAYVHLRSWASRRFQDLLEEQLLEGELAGADALVLDLRGGWGGADPGYLALFDPRAPEIAWTGRGEAPTRKRRAWTKPVVLLVDGSTRSGKEVIVHAFRRHGIGPVVGERTAGAVLGGQPFVLRDGSLLMLATADVLVDGERLEGVGVEPDLMVPRELRHSAGRDPQLEAALDEAARLATHASEPIPPSSP